MNYVTFVGTAGAPVPEALAIMQRDLPAWIEEMDGRGVRLLGRELDFPDKAMTVRVRDSETLVTDGPFAETKEFVAGFDLLDCADLDEAIEVAAASPVARFHPMEIRPCKARLRMGAGATAFGQGDDSAGTPYLLTVWTDGASAGSLEDPAVMADCDAWRHDLAERSIHILGSALAGPDTATTIRISDRQLQLSDGPFIETEEFIAGIDVISCADKSQALDLAAGHPMARYQAIEVRPFYSE
jgi:hypothetical protein